MGARTIHRSDLLCHPNIAEAKDARAGISCKLCTYLRIFENATDRLGQSIRIGWWDQQAAICTQHFRESARSSGSNRDAKGHRLQTPPCPNPPPVSS